jgi:hypothetical protein
MIIALRHSYSVLIVVIFVAALLLLVERSVSCVVLWCRKTAGTRRLSFSYPPIPSYSFVCVLIRSSFGDLISSAPPPYDVCRPISELANSQKNLYFGVFGCLRPELLCMMSRQSPVPHFEKCERSTSIVGARVRARELFAVHRKSVSHWSSLVDADPLDGLEDA